MAKKNKPNPVLAKYEAKLEREYRGRLHRNTEIDLIAFLIAANERLQVGPGRAGDLLVEVLDTKMQIASRFVEDDSDLLYTRHHLSKRIGAILGPGNWERYKEFFPLLQGFEED